MLRAVDPQAFLADALWLDLEVAPDGQLIAIGAVAGDREFSRKGRFDVRSALAALDVLATPCACVLGHNVARHDLPFLRTLAPNLRLLNRPVVDTLPLSALAFPAHPYHHLVKDYKLVRDAVNDPVADARLAARVFEDEWQALAAVAAAHPAVAAFYRFAFTGGGAKPTSAAGMARFFGALGVPAPTTAGAMQAFAEQAAPYACRTALRAIASAPPAPSDREPLAYALAWLRVSGHNSVLPPWTRHEFPRLTALLDALRDQPCDAADCAYCRGTHDPATQLKRFFGFGEFRAKPAARDGGSLQGEIVAAGLRNEPLLAVMPTGAGKSLCYQLPALARNFRRGSLTIVISPLQALMKDQVDGLMAKTGTTMAGTLNGLLTPPERGDTLERVRMGDIAILYVSPEQLRNKSFRDAIRHREIGAWVFDEAHCFSKWGHDFRPDYLYASRFIREFAAKQAATPPTVSGFTATAKPDVVEEIREHFHQEIGQELRLFDSTAERENLRFEVRVVGPAQKAEAVHALLSDRLPAAADGAAIVYCAKRRATEEMAEILQRKGWIAAAFHAGLTPPEKRKTQEDFLAGRIRVMCATNAFGMGIDKDNVRLVIHADVPGSLENYLQEAGRAGRDRQPADCVLLYNESDVETQFGLGASSQLSRRDIAEILRAVRRAKRDKNGAIVVTAGEILRDDDLQVSFQNDDRDADNKVRTALAMLERSEHLQRDQNVTRVFQARPAVASLEEAHRRLDALKLSARRRHQWLHVLEMLMNAEPDELLSADELAGSPPFRDREGDAPSPAPAGASAVGAWKPAESDTAYVMRVLHEMAEAGLVKKTTRMTAFVRHKVVNSSAATFERVCALEKALLDRMREEDPDAEGWVSLSLRRLNQRLTDAGFACAPDILLRLLRGLAADGKGLAGHAGSLELRYVGREQFRLKRQREWPDLVALAEKRRAVAGVALQTILRRVDPSAPAGKDLLVEFSAEEIFERLDADLALRGQIRDKHAALEHALMFLHEQNVIALQQGLAVFRQAMTLRVLPQSKGRGFTQGDYSPLERHYSERVFQVHVMREYARLAVEKLTAALGMVVAYFTLSREEFVRRYFPGRSDELKRATGAESYRRIVDELNNAIQTSIVAAKPDANLLVLAGPGSGKTRVVVHRCAYLLRVERVPARAILVLCFNRNAALTLRRRLADLVGPDARGVAVLTYHALAMRLAGASFAERARRAGAANAADAPDFDEMLDRATDLLRGKSDLPGLEPDEIRDRLLAGFRHILVDEYQDIDERQYTLVSALAGRTLHDPDSKLSILAVGDDDQNIYTFRGANVGFIRRFEKDYEARPCYLVENYRSTGHIVTAANQLIAANRDRMKGDHPIRVNRARQSRPPGGAWAARDRVAQGRVQVLVVNDLAHQTGAIVAEIRRIKALHPDAAWSDFAVLGRLTEDLAPIRAWCEQAGIPVVWNGDRDKLPPLYRVREIAAFLRHLGEHRAELQRADALIETLAAQTVGVPPNRWHALLRSLLEEWRDDSGNAELPVQAAIESLYEAMSEQRREPQTGDGLFLATVHSAKGMEFPHVFVPGGWRLPAAADKREEERRVFYVGMTRAKDTLCLVDRLDGSEAFARDLEGDAFFRRDAPEGLPVPPEVVARRYEVLTLADVFLDFAGQKPAEHPVHRHLAAIRPGDPLLLRPVANGAIEIQDAGGFVVGRLSHAAAHAWAGRLPTVESVRLLAAVRYTAQDRTQSEYAAQLRCDSWEVPIAEIMCRQG
jgi:ATP-dependent DNA helicase RecQ